MRKQSIFLLLFFVSFMVCVQQIRAMVYDNRYIPLLQYPYITVPGRDSHITGDFFITTANNATDDRERSIGIAELSGPFDQSQLAYSMQEAHIPLPPDFPEVYLDGELPWTMTGKLQTQGFAFSWQQAITDQFGFGLLALAMRSNSSINFFFDVSKASSIGGGLSESQILQLDDIRRAMLAELGLACNHVTQGGPGDVEAYLRWGDYYEYCFKLRSLMYGIRAGTLIPTGVTKKINQPASIPFGGNGFWGVYGSLHAEFELKEDWKVGFLIRISKRFARTRDERLPVGRPQIADVQQAPSEPQIFGVITGPVSITPGFSEIFYAYAQWEGIRQGFGARIQYSLVNHNQDHWKDERVDKTIPVNLKTVEHRSAWASEYITLSAFYDFDKENVERCGRPIVKAAWDIPFTLLVAHRFVHSYKVSLGLEFNF